MVIKTWFRTWLYHIILSFHDLVFQDMNTIEFVFLAYLQLHVPKSWQSLRYSRLGFSSLETFWVNNFNTRCLSRIKHFMTWSSKTWTTEMNMIVKTWHPKFWNVSIFATPCSQVMTMIAKTLLSKSWNFLVYKRLLRISFMTQDLVFQDTNTIGFVFLAYLQLHVPKSWQSLHYSRLGFPSLENFWDK